MKPNRRALVLLIGALLVVAMVSATAAWAADEVTISGKVNSSGILMAENGQEFKVAGGDLGNLVKSLVDRKVEVTGTVAEKDGQKTITVNSLRY